MVHLIQRVTSQPRHGPNQHMVLDVLLSRSIVREPSYLDLSHERIHLHFPIPKHLLLPHLRPAFRRVAKHVYPVRVLALSEALLRQPAVRAEDDGSGLRGEQRRNESREPELLRLVKEVKEGRCVDRAEPADERRQRRKALDRGQDLRRRHSRNGRRREGDGVEDISLDEWHRVGL
jgi:hypothetical protein